MQQMEHPFYSLSKTPVHNIREYRNGDNWIKVATGAYRLATIYDKDILRKNLTLKPHMLN
ncbi:MAG: replication initiator protein A [Verrucomicrobiota bacterium]